MLQRKSLAQEVASLIEQEIRQGVYALNEKLPSEPELMKKFGVGRSSIREAVKYLEQSGFVNVLQGIGTHVISTVGNESLGTTLQRADVAELYEVRQLLEVKIAEKAALNRKSEHLQQMKEKLQARRQFASEGLLEACVKADVDFHLTLAESCGNHLLHELYKIMSVQLMQFFANQYHDTAVFLKSQQLHEELYEQIKAQNSAKTLKIVNQIIGLV